MVRPKRKEDRTLVVRLGPGDLAHNVLTHSRETNGQRSTAELELKLGIIGEPFNSVSADEITKSDIQEWLLEQSEERDWSPAISALTVLRCRGREYAKDMCRKVTMQRSSSHGLLLGCPKVLGLYRKRPCEES